MIGMNAATGKLLEGIEHLRQSVQDILGTPLGTRVGRRWYGSHIPELLDQPLNDRTRLALVAAGALALMRQEPRIRATRITVETGDVTGAAVLRIVGKRLDGPRVGAPLTLAIPVRAASAS
jgi:phage baseplate assembly protein W